MNYFQIGQNIRGFRRNQGLTQEQLAEMINISVPHMSHIETGSTKLSLPVLFDLSKALGVSADDLLKGSVNKSCEKRYSDIISVLDSCTETELKILADILTASQKALKKYK